MLDSSPAPITRRPLKRSASAASLASMPTPPRTHRRHARGRSRGSCDSDSDDHADDHEDVVVTTDEEADEDAHRAKKRRTGPAAAAADEDAFWLSGATDGPSTTTTTTTAGGAATRSAKAQAPVAPPPLLYRKKAQGQSGEVAPVSPPPSHRRAVAIAPVTPEPPRTRAAARRALRDSPANPFLASPADPATDSATPSPIAGSSTVSPKTPTMGEKPTMTYVFRGVRRVYQNPLYDHGAGRARSPPAASLLPIEDPEYSPAINCTPKMLFPAARRAARAKGKSASGATAAATMLGGAKAKGGAKTKVRRARSPSLSGDELDAADLRPRKLAFGKRTLGEELVSAGEPLAL
ncbi:hypothetical protein HYPSUDRAFT_58890 [Hypholoma sublateritium FD-334 SS-4]|uniref:Uncharacterized protein n=1 Tax=Hypholoma sublateritium (strain FD-334 SS-4) TaxID=945553 RepID=A0A0D2P466_HYPSF|nr:hypothetical protein HYPSUDRAFT_58890 [Hypholoma sublateritium FD-334 SS-4]